MKNIAVRLLKDDEKRRFFEFARALPDRDFWGKKGRLLREDYDRFRKFFDYIEPFQPKCFLVAEDNNDLMGFVVAVYNPAWMSDLIERYRHDVDKRAYILGIAFVQRRKDVLKALTDELIDYFSKKGIKSVEYPTLGNICLTTGTDVLTPKNVDALIMFREAGFKISECYYSMKLDLESYKCDKKYPTREGSFRFREKSIEIVKQNEILANITWNSIEDGKTSIGINVAQAHRGRSFGTALMAEALHRLKTDGAKVIELGVDGNNLPALRLYRKFGFEPYATHFYIIAPS
jgi:ribosomal protein S18 acetylase RimI-like enzyme